MKRKTLGGIAAFAVLAIALTVLAGPADEGKDDKGQQARAAFERLKKFAGEWVAANPKDAAEADKTAVTYRVTSAGTAVIETLLPGADHEMITMYYMDGDDLVLTHYCALGNQPHMKFQPTSQPDRWVFEFVGGSNIDPAKDRHMHRVVFEIVNDNRFDAAWTLYADGQPGDATTFAVTRKTK